MIMVSVYDISSSLAKMIASLQNGNINSYLSFNNEEEMLVYVSIRAG